MVSTITFVKESVLGGRCSVTRWFTRLKDYRAKYPELANQLYLMQHRQLPDGWDKKLPVFPADAKGMATRVSSGEVLNEVAKRVPWLMGGSADLGAIGENAFDL